MPFTARRKCVPQFDVCSAVVDHKLNACQKNVCLNCCPVCVVISMSESRLDGATSERHCRQLAGYADMCAYTNWLAAWASKSHCVLAAHLAACKGGDSVVVWRRAGLKTHRFVFPCVVACRAC